MWEDTCLVDVSPPIRAYVNTMYPKTQLAPKESCFLNFVRHYFASPKN